MIIDNSAKMAKTYHFMITSVVIQLYQTLLIMTSTNWTLVLVARQSIPLESFNTSCMEHVRTAQQTHWPSPEAHQTYRTLFFLPTDSLDLHLFPIYLFLFFSRNVLSEPQSFQIFFYLSGFCDFFPLDLHHFVEDVFFRFFVLLLNFLDQLVEVLLLQFHPLFNF